MTRSAIVMADVLAAAPDGAAQLAALSQAGVRPVVLAPAVPPGTPAPDAAGHLVVESPQSAPACWEESVDLLADVAARCAAVPSELFVLCADPDALARSATAGCRPVLVLAGRTLADVFGAAEPPLKHVPAAPDLGAAVGYVLEEVAHDAALGPFPFAATGAVDARVAAPMPNPRDLALFFGLVTVAGVAIALGIAYLLQEVYQHMEFPPIAYWVTLQFIPQTWRGVLFLGVGALIGIAARPVLSRVVRRRPGRG